MPLDNTQKTEKMATSAARKSVAVAAMAPKSRQQKIKDVDVVLLKACVCLKEGLCPVRADR